MSVAQEMARLLSHLCRGSSIALVLAMASFLPVGEFADTSLAAEPEMRVIVTDPPGACSGEVCALALGQTFTLAAEVVEAPANGYVVVQSFIEYGNELTYQPADDLTEEFLWPDLGELVAFRGPPGVTGTEGFVNHSGITGLTTPLRTSTFKGIVFELQMRCSTSPSSTVLELLPLGDPRAGADGGDGAGFVEPNGVTQVPTADTLTINCGEGAAPPAPVDGATEPPAGAATSTPTEPRTRETARPDARNGEAPPEAADSGGLGPGAIAGIAAGAAAAVVGLGAGAWWLRKRRTP